MKNPSISTLLAKTYSTLFHPLLIPILGVFFIFKALSDSFILHKGLLYIYIILIVFTILLPALTIFLFHRLKFLSIGSKKNTDSLLTVSIFAINYFLGYLLIKNLPFQIHYFFEIFLFGAIIIILISIILNYFLRLNFHMIGIGALLALSFLLSIVSPAQNLMYILILATGFLGTAQLLLQKNSGLQVLISFILGFFGMLFVFTY